MKIDSRNRKAGTAVRRRGSVFPVFVISLLLVSATGAALIRTVLTQRALIRSDELRTQTEWLLQSGAAKAAASLAAAPGYPGEVWTIPADQLRNTYAATIQIDVKRPGQDATSGGISTGNLHEVNLPATCSSQGEQLSRLSRRIVIAGARQQEP